MLERYELDAFVTLVEELHFGRTADRLRVSTARVSQTISKLERRIGVPLFDRTSRRVEVTASGRRLYDEIRPAWRQIGTAVERAVEHGRGLGGTLTVGFTGAAGGRLVAEVATALQRRTPACEVRIREAQVAQTMPWLRDGEVDLTLGTIPVTEPGISTGPVLVSECRLLAVAARHPYARRHSIEMEDLAGVTLLQLPVTVADSMRRDRTPPRTPSGRIITTGASAATFQELLTLVSSDRGVFTVGAQVQRFYRRPDIVYVPIIDAPALEWALFWRSNDATARIREFSAAAEALVAPRHAEGDLDWPDL